MGGVITEAVLLRATFIDAILITLISIPFLYFSPLKEKSWFIVPAGIAIAIGIEWRALALNRWAYNEYMPIIPFISTGLTPTIQLGLLGYFSYKIAERIVTTS